MKAQVKTVEHQEASRLPDTSWMWRRVLIYTICAVLLYIAWRVSERVPDTDGATLRQINRYCYSIIALGLTLYGVGATVTDVARLVTAFLSTKKITVAEASPPATVEEGRVESPSEDGGELRPEDRIR